MIGLRTFIGVSIVCRWLTLTKTEAIPLSFRISLLSNSTMAHAQVCEKPGP